MQGLVYCQQRTSQDVWKNSLIVTKEEESTLLSQLKQVLLSWSTGKRHWCIDASKEDGSLGRLVNDNHKSPNCVMKKITVNNRPHLCLFAVKQIETGDEIEYNYGDSKWPWRGKVAVGPDIVAAVQTTTPYPDQTSQDYSKRDGVKQVAVSPDRVAAVQTTTPYPDHSTLNSLVAVGPDIVAAVQTTTPYPDQTSQDYSKRDGVKQVSTSQNFSLVNYSDSEIDEDCLKEQPLTRGVALKNSSIENVLRLPDYCEPIPDSDESVVYESDHFSNYSILPSDQQAVPKLKRTKSIIMKSRVPEFSDSLYDSSDECPAESLASRPSRRPKRVAFCPAIVESDDSYAGSEDDYIPDKKDEKATLQIAKMSKVLLAMEQGRLGDFQGKSLDEINISVNETICMKEVPEEDMDVASMPEEQGSELDSGDEPTSTSYLRSPKRGKRPKKRETVCMKEVPKEDMDVASMPEEQGSELDSGDEPTSTSYLRSPKRGKRPKKRGKVEPVKRTWTQEECAAVERHLKKFIVLMKVPKKMDCQQCIIAEPQALANRDWKALERCGSNLSPSLLGSGPAVGSIYICCLLAFNRID
uniref:SET domain-containing protein n=1 Tax=Knipowitschia caucasica TaxID=637954 RepID=A0AAV2KT12_KNICA